MSASHHLQSSTVPPLRPWRGHGGTLEAKVHRPQAKHAREPERGRAVHGRAPERVPDARLVGPAVRPDPPEHPRQIRPRPPELTQRPAERFGRHAEALAAFVLLTQPPLPSLLGGDRRARRAVPATTTRLLPPTTVAARLHAIPPRTLGGHDRPARVAVVAPRPGLLLAAAPSAGLHAAIAPSNACSASAASFGHRSGSNTSHQCKSAVMRIRSTVSNWADRISPSRHALYWRSSTP